MLPVICEFLQVYSDVNVSLALGDRMVNLVEDRVDLALRIGELPDSGLVASSLGSIRRVVCASPTYLAEHGVPQRPHDLGNHQCISFEPLMAANEWRFTFDTNALAVPIRSRLVVTSAEAAVDAAIGGLGVTCVLSYQVESALRAQKVQLLLRPFEPAPLPVSFLYSGQGRLPLKLRALLDFAAPRLRARLKRALDAPPRPVRRTRRRAGSKRS